MKYTFTRNGKKEKVALENWVWGIVYQDGTELKQFGEDGVFHQIGEVDQDKIKMAVLYQPGDMSKRIDIPWKKGMKLIHKYRHVIFNMATPEERKVKVYVFGYKDGAHHHQTYILPDGRMVNSPDPELDLTQYEI